MTREELCELRNEVLKNKESFSKLNAKYNELLMKKYESNNKKTDMSDKEFINLWGSNLYWIRYFVIFVPLFIMGAEFDIMILLVFVSLGLRIFDEKVLLPMYLQKKKLKNKKTKKDIEQDELYEQVCEAREKYHDLCRKYEKEISKLTEEEANDYQEYLDYIDGILNQDVYVKECMDEDNVSLDNCKGETKLFYGKG